MLRLLAVFALLYCVAVPPVRGQNVDYHRNNSINGNFRVPLYWTPLVTGPGGETDRVHFDRGQSPVNRYTISNVEGVNEQLIIENDSIVFEIDDYETVSPNGGFTSSVIIGQLNGDVGDVIFTGGPGSQLRSVRTSIGFSDVAIGVATVDGAGFNWTNSGALRVGENGNGTLKIQNGGTVNSGVGSVGANLGSAGSAIIDGDGSGWNMNSSDLFIGRGSAATGTINIQDGGYVSAARSYISFASTSTGEAIVDGVGSNWTNSSLFVGYEGNATLNIQSGGMICSGGASIGTLSAGIGGVTIDGSGSSWMAESGLYVGFGGSGSLTIQNGGLVSNPVAVIGLSPGSVGFATVTGADSQWVIEENLTTGGNPFSGANGGSGTLTINSGGTVFVGDETTLFPNGTLNLDDGTFTSDSISFNGGGSFNFNAGVLHVGTYIGDLVNEAGTLAPGQSAGSTTVVGDYTQEQDGSLEIEVGGPLVNTGFDFVNVTGDVFLDGELDLVLINGFLPTPEQSFTVLNADALFGFFSNATDNQRVETTGGEGSFLVRYGVTSPNPTQIILSEFEPTFILGESLLVTRGNHVSGSIVELAESENADVSIQRAAADIQSRTEFVVKAISPTSTPAGMDFTLEGAVFARSNVVQTIELYDYVAAAWVLIDSRNAARSPAPDLVVTVAATGDLSRFVEAGTMCMEARVRYQSDNPRQNFASNTDRAVWTIH